MFMNIRAPHSKNDRCDIAASVCAKTTQARFGFISFLLNILYVKTISSCAGKFKTSIWSRSLFKRYIL